MAVKTIEIQLSPQEMKVLEDNPLRYYVKHNSRGNEKVTAVQIDRKSLDARKPHIIYRVRLLVYTGDDKPEEPKLPTYCTSFDKTAHIVGFGPAGIFCALKCLELGIKPIVIERGKQVKDRRRDVAKLNRDGTLNTESNYCFGEGGAGTFSDGKLYTRSQKRGKIKEVLEYFVLHGANPNILYEAHPHIGTNKLPGIIEKLRATIVENGGEVLFEHKLEGLILQDQKIRSIEVNGKELDVDRLVLATGHSARDIFELLHQKKIELEPKPFAMGFRIEHPQEEINKIQYHNATDRDELPPASYSLVAQVKGKGAFSFCMCPGGIIAPATTDKNAVVVNGWSPSKRNGKFANSGWVTEIDEDEWKDFAEFGNLAGLRFQQHIEEKAFQLAGGGYKVPAQNLTDYLAGKKSSVLNENSYHPGVVSVDLNTLYPASINFRLREGLRHFTKRMKGFDHDNAIVTAPESRTSSPVRIPRGKNLQHTEIPNLYPCGEGAGYAGGIVSAALDGIRVAKAMADKF
jgi:uncharacterized FAD-dependent dehydrogenase